MSLFQVRVEIESGDPVRVQAPYATNSEVSGEAYEVPWNVNFGFGMNVAFSDTAKLTELRDAITAALDAHGEVS